MPDPRNIILTGIPRSGTTLLTALADSLPDAVALNEPRWQYDEMMKSKGKLSAKEFAGWVAEDFANTRRKLVEGTPIPERRLRDGTAVTNYYRWHLKQQNPEEIFDIVDFTRPGLTENCTLAIKHNGLYLSVLRQLAETDRFTIIAILRHPVGVIGSWNNIPIPLRKGEMPGAMGYWKDMRELTGSSIPLLEKQVRMYDLVCRRLLNLKDMIHIVKYEDVTENLNLVGSILGYDVSYFSDQVKKRDVNFYGDMSKITEAVKRFGTHYRYFYPD